MTFTTIVFMHHVAVDDYVLDVLMRDLAGDDHSPAAFLVYLVLWTELFRSGDKRVGLSLATFAERSGLSKTAVQGALKILKRRGLVKATKTAATAVPQYELHRHWVRRRAKHLGAAAI